MVPVLVSKQSNHFLDFISRPNFVQDVAYGTKTLKLSNEEKMEIPNVVRTVIASRIVDSVPAVLSGNRFPFTWEVNSLQYFTGTYQNKIMIQNQKKSEKGKKNCFFFYILLSHLDITKISLYAL